MTTGVTIELGPSKSKAVATAVERFADRLVAQGPGTATFVFRSGDEVACQELLHVVSRLRAIRIHERGRTYTRREFLDELWDREREAEEAAWRAAYEAAGLCWQVPDDEFLSLAYASANGGDWDFDDERPMSPEARQNYLDLFCGEETVDPAVLARVEAKLDEFKERDEHPSEREFAYSLDRSPFQIENEYRWAQERRGGEWGRRRAEASGSAMYFRPSCGCSTCRRLYLEEDGETPRFFLPHEIPPPGSNRGRPLEDWLPTMPPLHLHSFTLAQVLNHISVHVDEFSFVGPTMVTRLPSWERVPLTEALPGAVDPVAEHRVIKDRPPLQFGLKIEVEVVSGSSRSADGAAERDEPTRRTGRTSRAESAELPDDAPEVFLPPRQRSCGPPSLERVPEASSDERGPASRPGQEGSSAAGTNSPGRSLWIALLLLAGVAGGLVLAWSLLVAGS